MNVDLIKKIFLAPTLARSRWRYLGLAPSRSAWPRMLRRRLAILGDGLWLVSRHRRSDQFSGRRRRHHRCRYQHHSRSPEDDRPGVFRSRTREVGARSRTSCISMSERRCRKPAISRSADSRLPAAVTADVDFDLKSMFWTLGGHLSIADAPRRHLRCLVWSAAGQFQTDARLGIQRELRSRHASAAHRNPRGVRRSVGCHRRGQGTSQFRAGQTGRCLTTWTSARAIRISPGRAWWVSPTHSAGEISALPGAISTTTWGPKDRSRT